MNDLFAIVGPTASGKTALSIALAKQIGGAVVSVDSMQIYRGMDIGTAKPSVAERDGVPHYMLDIIDFTSSYSVQQYVKQAREIIDSLREKHIPVVICGGTGLYFDHLIQDTTFANFDSDPAYMKELNLKTNDELFDELCKVDPLSASSIHPENRKRVIRALEVYHVSGTPISDWADKSHDHADPLSPTIIGLDFADRSVLHNRIAQRVEQMMDAGLPDEVADLYQRGLAQCRTAAAAIGYKELIGFLRGEETLEQAKEKIIIRSRQYAKRQLTWFRRNPNIRWYMVDQLGKDLIPSVLSFCIKGVENNK